MVSTDYPIFGIVIDKVGRKNDSGVVLREILEEII